MGIPLTDAAISDTTADGSEASTFLLFFFFFVVTEDPSVPLTCPTVCLGGTGCCNPSTFPFFLIAFLCRCLAVGPRSQACSAGTLLAAGAVMDSGIDVGVGVGDGSTIPSN